MLQQRLSAGFLYHRLPAQGSRVLLTLGGGRSTRRTAAVHTAAKGADARPSRPIRSTVLSLLAVGGLGLSYLIYSDHLERTDDHPSLHNQAGIATQNVRFRRHIPHSPTSTVTNGSSKDPLSILDPAELASSTAHLIDLPLSQLMRAYIVFLASSSPFLVDIAPATIEKFEWLRENLPFGLGRPLWGLLVFGMRQTFFAQFVAGETAEKSFPLLEKLHSRGCSAMLNWSAEADHALVPSTDSENDLHQPKILKESFDELHKAVKAAIDFHPEYKLRPTMVAIKMTGLVQDPAVFERFTEAIERGDHESLSLPTTSAHQQKASISSRSGKKGKDLSNSDIVTLLAVYNNLSSLLQIASLNGVRIAFDAEQSWYQPALSRIVTLLSREYNRNNQKEGKIRAPIVYNTYQTNLKATESVLREDLLKAKEGGYSLGIKLVRGAYVTSENARAAKKNVPSKVWPNKAATDACFDACSELILQEVVDSLSPSSSSGSHASSSWLTSFFTGRAPNRAPGPSIVYATHNATSIKRSLEQMRDKALVVDHGRVLDVDPVIRGRISYAQLLGMTDNLTTAMFQLFPHTPTLPGEPPLLPITALYVPYGQIDRVLPYLVRRAQENKAILQGSDGSGRGGAAEQRKAIGKEIRRRLIPFFLE